jgi:glycosyltransferase involved in cell wall biosynthesis
LKVAILIDALNQGGAERQVLNTTWALAKKGCQVELIHYYETDTARAGYDHPAFREARVTCIPKRGRPFLFLWRLSRHLRRGRIDIVHSFKSVPTLYACLAGRMAGVPVILGGCQGEYEDRGLARLGHRLVKRSLAGWITNTRSIVESLVKEIGVRREDCFVVYNGIDPRAFASGLSSGDARKKLGVSPGAPTVTIVAGLRPVKNHRLFLDMARLVLARLPETRFLLAGEGDLRPALENYARELNISDRAMFLGSRSDIPDVLAATDVAVLTSHSEGLPNAMLESMAVGIPVVTTDYAGAREFMTDGEEGFIVPRGDAPAMADRVIRLLREESLRASMGEKGARTVAGRFSMDTMAAGFLSAYQVCMARAARASA